MHGVFTSAFDRTRGELAKELAIELKLEVVGEASSKEMEFPVSVSSSESAKSAQHTPERRTQVVCISALEWNSGEFVHELKGELAQELTGEFLGDLRLKEARLLQRNAPEASSSAAFSCTHSGSIKDRKGLLEF